MPKLGMRCHACGTASRVSPASPVFARFHPRRISLTTTYLSGLIRLWANTVSGELRTMSHIQHLGVEIQPNTQSPKPSPLGRIGRPLRVVCAPEDDVARTLTGS